MSLPPPGRTAASKRYAAYEHFQVLGSVLEVVSSGLGSFWPLASRIMLEEGLGAMGPDGLVQLDPATWYPLVSTLRVFDRLRRDFGDVALRQMGTQLPKLARLTQPDATLHSAFEVLDLVYHAHHAVDGQRLLDEKTGELQEGIGHYRVRAVPGQQQFLCDSSSAYPCVFDQALLLSFAQSYEPTATLTHLEPTLCRAHGAAQCGYLIVW